MKRAEVALALLLGFGTLTVWIEDRWAWGVFQVGIFVLAGWRALRPTPFPLRPALGVLALAAIWPFIQLASGTSISPADTLAEALTWFTFLLVFGLSSEALALPGPRRWFLGSIVTFGMCLAFAAMLQQYTSNGRIFWLFRSGYSQGVLGPFVNRNQFAAWVELLLPVALYLAATDRHLRPVFGCAAAVLFSSVIASASRAGSVLVCGEVLVVVAALAARRAAPRKALGLAALQFLVLAALATIIVGWQSLETRWVFGQSEVVRVDAGRASWKMVHDRPWMGSGLGTWSIIYPRYAGLDAGVFVNQAHDDWAQWSAEG
ncbi:MAG TPA: O-antigen ligase family protein, partial [Bryobacteraceae bacterium]